MTENYLIGIGKRIREIRKEHKKTIVEIAQKASVSKGLISQIENGRTIPSVPVLLAIIQALDTEIGDFFKVIDMQTMQKFLVTRRDEFQTIEKEIHAAGFSYQHIFSKQLQTIGVELVMLEVAPNSNREKVVTDAYELKYILSGEIVYDIDGDQVTLYEGDVIFFDGRHPHVPMNRSEKSCKMLVIYFYNES